MPRETPQQLWTERLAGRSALPSLLVQLFSAKEMRYLLGSSKNRSKEEMAQRLMIATKGGTMPPTGEPQPTLTAPVPAAPAAQAPAQQEEPEEEEDDEDMCVGPRSHQQYRPLLTAVPLWRRRSQPFHDPCTQTLAAGWYTPKYTGNHAKPKHGSVGDVVWCKYSTAPWWPALLAVRPPRPAPGACLPLPPAARPS